MAYASLTRCWSTSIGSANATAGTPETESVAESRQAVAMTVVRLNFMSRPNVFGCIKDTNPDP